MNTSVHTMISPDSGISQLLHGNQQDDFENINGNNTHRMYKRSESDYEYNNIGDDAISNIEFGYDNDAEDGIGSGGSYSFDKKYHFDEKEKKDNENDDPFSDTSPLTFGYLDHNEERKENGQSDNQDLFINHLNRYIIYQHRHANNKRF